MKNKLMPWVQALFSAIIVLAMVSCKKENRNPDPLTPRMEYLDLDNREVKENIPPFNIDVDHDGKTDIAFGTLVVGDPVRQADKLQFWVLSKVGVNLPVNNNEEIPVMNHGEPIALGNFNGYSWFEVLSVLLVQKVTPVTGPVVWEGNWKNAMHKYVPFQVMKNNDRYNGWIEISIDIPREKIVLHKAAISKEANKAITAGK